MHPIFTNGKQLALYILGYLPIGAVLVIGFGHADAWGTAAAFFMPLTVLYGVLGMTAYYVCRAFPITQQYRIWRALPAQAMAAITAGGFSVGIAWVWSAMLESLNLDVHPKMYLDQPWTLFAVGVLLFGLAIAFHYALIASLEAQRSENQILESSLLVREAELKALRAQLNPHFLFNSLNSISALTSIDPSRARDMCVLLGDFLRMTLGLGEKTLVRFSEELELLEKYLAIEKVRFGDRLKMQENVHEDSKTCMLPPLLLQPLVENAVKHGIAGLSEGGQVRLSAERQNGRLAILVENSWDPEAPPRRSGGMGLKNVQQRLEARYGKEASLRVNTEGELFQVSLSLPVESEEKA